MAVHVTSSPYPPKKERPIFKVLPKPDE
jgi:hypothetical protein